MMNKKKGSNDRKLKLWTISLKAIYSFVFAYKTLFQGTFQNQHISNRQSAMTCLMALPTVGIKYIRHKFGNEVVIIFAY